MATEVDICNTALVEVGASAITDEVAFPFTPTTKEKRLCNQEFPKALAQFLYSHPWRKAMKRDKLLPNGNTPEFEWDHEYDIPADLIRLRGVYEPETGQAYDSRTYEVEGEKILSVCDELYVKYVFDLPVAELTPSMAEVVALKLSLNFTRALSSKQEIVNELMQRHLRAFTDLRTNDSQEMAQQVITTDEWLNERLDYTGQTGYPQLQ